MPARAKRPCRHKGCAAITNDVSGYCDQHRKQHAGDGWRNYQSGKSRQERGYGRLSAMLIAVCRYRVACRGGWSAMTGYINFAACLFSPGGHLSMA